MKKKISIIGSVGIPANYGGFETLVENLTQKLHQKFDITVYCSSKAYQEKLTHHNGSQLRYVNLKANGVQSILYDFISILFSLRFADTLLILGVSGCFCLPFVKVFSKKKVIVNVDGLEWKRQKWGYFAKKFLKLSEHSAVKFADCVISDNKVVQDYILSEYDVESKLIAYGADHVCKNVFSPSTLQEYSFLSDPYMFKVCRIEPENNIEMILAACSKFKKVNMVLIGNWANSAYGITLKEKYKMYSHIFLLDPIYNPDILNEIRSQAYVYLHGHSAGGTNPSLVEAMFLGLPIFAYDAQYNIETTANKALYFNSEYQLLALLNNLRGLQLNNLGNELKTVANKRYTWAGISDAYSVLF